MSYSPDRPDQSAQLDRFAQYIEGFRLQPLLDDETFTRMGSLVLDEQSGLDLQAGVRPPLSGKQYDLVERASLGDTTRAAAMNLGWKKTEVVEVREQLLAVYRVPAMSAVVNKVIVERALPVTVVRDPDLRLEREIDLILEAICVGISTNNIARILRQDRGFIQTKIGTTNSKLGANGKTNSVRNAYERGIREIPEQS